MRFSEQILFLLAKKLYRTNSVLTKEQKESLHSLKMYEIEREKNIKKITGKLKEHGIDLKGNIVVDFGCSTGAITKEYIEKGVRKVIGLDIDQDAIDRANKYNQNPNIEFVLNTDRSIPLEDNSVDIIVSDSVFEHVTHPKEIIDEFNRILVPGGKAFIGTWGWYHPFAPHFFAVMPVPWCHVFFSEKTIMRTCNRIYNSDWYKPVFWDFDEDGNKIAKYTTDHISTDYVNKLFIRDFEKIFSSSQFKYTIYPRSFSNKLLKFTKPFTKVPYIREVVTSYFYAVLEKQPE